MIESTHLQNIVSFYLNLRVPRKPNIRKKENQAFPTVLMRKVGDHDLWLHTWGEGLPRWLSGKEPTCQCRRPGFDPWVRRIPWRKKRLPTPVFLPGESHGQRSLVATVQGVANSRLQFSSVAQLCPTLCDPVDCSTPGLPVHHQLPEFTQSHVHWVGDAIQPSHPLSSPSPPAFNLSQRQGLFQWVSSSHQVVSWADTHLSGVLALPDTYVLIQLSRASHCSCPLRGALVIILMTMKTLKVLYKTLSFFVLQCTLVAVEMQSLLMRSRCLLCHALWDTSLAPRERGCIHNLCHYN